MWECTVSHIQYFHDVTANNIRQFRQIELLADYARLSSVRGWLTMGQ